MYAPNGGTERVILFEKLGRVLKTLNLGDIIIMAGDWNCTLNFNIDRNAEEPHNKSSLVLSNVVKNLNLEDIWRIKNVSGYYRNLGSLRAGTRHHGEFSVMRTPSFQPFLKSYWLTPVK